MEEKQLIIKEFNAIFLEMGKIYKHKWFKKTEDENKAFFALCINQLVQSAVNPAYIKTAFVKAVEMKQYSLYPPTIQEFVQLCLGVEVAGAAVAEPGDRAFERAADTAYRKMKANYRALWDRSTEDVDVFQYSIWISSLKAAGLTVESIEMACAEVSKLGQYRIYPPSINAFIDIARILSSPEDIPFVENAYAIATSGKKDINKFVRIARQRFGFYALRVETGQYIKDRFDNTYRQVIIDFFEGNLNDELISQAEFKQDEISETNKASLLEMLERITKN